MLKIIVVITVEILEILLFVVVHSCNVLLYFKCVTSLHSHIKTYRFTYFSPPSVLTVEHVVSCPVEGM